MSVDYSSAWDRLRGSVQDRSKQWRPAIATPRIHGAMRYRCPTTGGFVLVTDEPTLKQLCRPPAYIRCAVCGEQHIVLVEAPASTTTREAATEEA